MKLTVLILAICLITVAPVACQGSSTTPPDTRTAQTTDGNGQSTGLSTEAAPVASAAGFSDSAFRSTAGEVPGTNARELETGPQGRSESSHLDLPTDDSVTPLVQSSSNARNLACLTQVTDQKRCSPRVVSAFALSTHLKTTQHICPLRHSPLRNYCREVCVVPGLRQFISRFEELQIQYCPGGWAIRVLP